MTWAPVGVESSHVPPSPPGKWPWASSAPVTSYRAPRPPHWAPGWQFQSTASTPAEHKCAALARSGRTLVSAVNVTILGQSWAKPLYQIHSEPDFYSKQLFLLTTQMRLRPFVQFWISDKSVSALVAFPSGGKPGTRGCCDPSPTPAVPNAPLGPEQINVLK